MNNPIKILRALDSKLDHKIDLIIFGKAAIVLGFPTAPENYGITQDVDGILQTKNLETITNDEKFWDALESTNQDLKPEGLYMTHLFQEEQIILSPNWSDKTILLELGLNHIQISRPCTLDLILTKMMRCDKSDLDEIRFLIESDHITPEELEAAFKTARVPDENEILDLFQRAQPLVLEIAKELAGREGRTTPDIRIKSEKDWGQSGPGSLG